VTAEMQLRADRDVAWFNEIGRESFPGFVGVEITDVEQGSLSARLRVRDELFAPNGFLHAGAVITLADTAAGYATVAHLPDGATGFTTLELKANFVRAAREGVLLCTAEAVHLGRSTQVWDAILRTDADERPVALFRCTQLVLYAG
jgi:1,4-dihydroxy-2-naphthoyl-CoA hydrolase